MRPRPPSKESQDRAFIKRKQAATTPLEYLKVAMEESKKQRTRLQRLFAREGINTPQTQRALHEALRMKFRAEIFLIALRYGVRETDVVLAQERPFEYDRVPEGFQDDLFATARHRVKG